MFTKIQHAQLSNLNIDPNDIINQIENFKKGFPFINLIQPATVGNGIIALTDVEITNFVNKYETHNFAKISVFIPASGAATRMFKSFYEYMNNANANTELAKFTEVKTFFENITSYAFYSDLALVVKETGRSITDLLNSNQYVEIIKFLLTEKGLNYGSSPKALLKFHTYTNSSRTPVEEHIVEATQYAKCNKQVNIHFTISDEHALYFEKLTQQLIEKYEEENKVKYDISWSFQKKNTDTLAVDLNNKPVLDTEGKFIFRPGGHGALLSNLNEIDADLIFIKNIDNIVPDHLKEPISLYKKALAGILISYREKIFDYLTYIEWHDKYPHKKRVEIINFLSQLLQINIPTLLIDADDQIFGEFIKSKLDKPIRVCGMVKNTGEPGGGPFWIENRRGEKVLQIIESSQVNLANDNQKQLFNSATHFNPVDIVCSIKDFNNQVYNLPKYRDPYSGFITEKSVDGVKIKAQELPGLWNGSMANWITIFVEVPISTFNPVKTVNDLLRREHQPAVASFANKIAVD